MHLIPLMAFVLDQFLSISWRSILATANHILARVVPIVAPSVSAPSSKVCNGNMMDVIIVASISLD
jgi:hypothetical protein